MGRRSINTTKSGKYMNPTDQARKEARKLELKKNKKQRQMVRAAVLKGKDPAQIIEEMEKIDQMEFNVLQPSPLNEKVLKDKRKKLRDTLERVLIMYHKDDLEKWSELKRVQADYERRRNQLVTFYESVKHAQQVSVDDIPLPTVQVPDHSSGGLFANVAAKIPLPTTEIKLPDPTKAPVGILKKAPSTSTANLLVLQQLSTSQMAMDVDDEPPGVPVGPPPDLSSCSEGEDDDEQIPTTKTIRFSDEVTVSHRTVDEDADSDEEDGESGSGGGSVKPTSLQQKMLALSGQNVDDFMKEMEVVQKAKDTEIIEERTVSKVSEPTRITDTSLAPPGTSESIPPPHQRQVMPPPMMFPPTMRIPPGPPPGRPNLPPGPPPGLPPRLAMRIPPAPPRMLRLPAPPVNLPAAALATPNVLSAGPQLINRSDSTKQGATIMAKPQIRNLSVDVTRFVPSALRVKREDKKQKTNTRSLVNELKQKEIMSQAMFTGQPTKDDAYMQFMKEMEGLL